jgi:hypothetical protein
MNLTGNSSSDYYTLHENMGGASFIPPEMLPTLYYTPE